jgi:hypothetical protein
MRPSKDLRTIYRSVSFRILRLRRIFVAATNSNEPRRRVLLAFCAIELDNLIISGLRAFTVSTLSCARRASGVKVTTNRQFSGEDQIAAFVVSTVAPKKYARMNAPATIARRDEQTIRDPKEIEKVLIGAAATNLISLQNALALNSPIFSNLKFVRHFYAHRNGDTWSQVSDRARNLGLMGIKCTDDLLVARVPNRPVMVFEDWLDDAELFFDELVK